MTHSKRLFKGVSQGRAIYAYAHSATQALRLMTDRALKIYKSFEFSELWVKNGDWMKIPVPGKLSSNQYQLINQERNRYR